MKFCFPVAIEVWRVKRAFKNVCLISRRASIDRSWGHIFLGVLNQWFKEVEKDLSPFWGFDRRISFHLESLWFSKIGQRYFPQLHEGELPLISWDLPCQNCSQPWQALGKHCDLCEVRVCSLFIFISSGPSTVPSPKWVFDLYA